MPDQLPAPDRWALADLVADYAHAVDERDFDALRVVFSPDAVLTTPRGTRNGIDEILSAMAGLHRYTATMHHTGVPRVTATGPDHASGLTSCEAHHLSVDGTGDRRSDHIMHIRYHDEFVRTAQGWRIAIRRLEVAWSEDRPV